MIAWLNRNPYLLIAVAGILLLAGLGARDALQSQDAPVLAIEEGRLEPGSPIRVHVAGSVAVPGVYELGMGQRVEDAVAAAGGALPGADLDAINLARKLRDGEQVLVQGPSPAAAVVEEPSPIVTEAPAPTPTVDPTVPLDLNVATREELIALPGIGEAYSRRIVDSRIVDGPFASIEDLLNRDLVPARTFEIVRTMITVSTP